MSELKESVKGKRAAELKEKEMRKKRQFKMGTVALWETLKFQKSISFLIRRFPFVRWVRDIAQEQWGNLRFWALTLLALQEVVEVYS